MSRALLDVNLLVALLDRDHVDHRRATAWLRREGEHGWASCAITQNGFVRVVSQPRYPSPVPVTEAILRLRRAASTRHHEFWSCDTTILDPSTVEHDRLHGPRQVTDAYLLTLAVARDGRLATLDRGVPLSAVVGAASHHLVVV